MDLMEEEVEEEVMVNGLPERNICLCRIFVIRTEMEKMDGTLT